MEQAITQSSAPGGLERWALLIGINYYFDGTARDVKTKPLTGCVRDVEAVEQYLEATNVPKGNVTKLTATEGTCGIKEEESCWPTRNNIVRELDNILEKAKHGALVYIHYSGHGILRKKLEDDPDDGGNRFTGVALVPTDVKRGGAYLSAYQLGAKIKAMVEQKEIRVTLVLDCCHSGRGIRGGDSDSDDGADDDEKGDVPSGYGSIRGIDEEDESILASDLAADEEADRENGDHRGMDVGRPSWLEDPRSCTILTACGVLQRAREISFKASAGCNGVFTYWMLRILNRDRARPPSYSTVRDQVERKIGTSLRKGIQIPGIFGDTHHEFFGQRVLPWTVSSRVFKENGEYVLDVGSAQGVAIGATYELRPGSLDASHDEELDASISVAQRHSQLRISRCFDLRSKARPVLEEDKDAIDRLIDMGYEAVLHRWALPSRTVINAVSTLTIPEASYLGRFKSLLEAELSTTHNLVLDIPRIDAKEDFRLAVDQQGTIEIQSREGKPLPWLPRVTIHHSGAVEKLGDLLRHVTRFQAIKDLCYGKPRPKNRLEPNRFKFVAYDENELLLPKATSGDFMARNNQNIQVKFTVEEGLEPVYVTIFHLTDQFGVEKRFPRQGELPCELLKCDNHLIRGKMTIPAGREANSTEVKEIMRAYVYRGSRVPLWSELQLPQLPAEAAAEACEQDRDVRGLDEIEAFEEDGLWSVLDCCIVVLP